MVLQGWRLTIVLVVLLLFGNAALMLGLGTDEAGIRALVRVTARIAVVLFVVVFGASSLRRFWRTRATKWLLANRRYLGVSFAVAHGLHLVALFLFMRLYPEPFFEGTAAFVVVVGGFVSVLVAAMALTSSDRAQAALGKNWKRLHTLGGYGAWAIYFYDYIGGLFSPSIYTPFGVLVVGVMALRMAALRRSRAVRKTLPGGAATG